MKTITLKGCHKVKPVLISLIKAFVFFILLFFAGCMQEELCEDITLNPLRIGFYSSQGEQPVSLDSLSVIGLGHDSYLYNNVYNVGRIEIPLDVAVDSCAFALIFPENTDTLKVYYERNLSLVSVECGFVTFFNIDKVRLTNNVAESYSIESYNVTNVNEEHIHIYIPSISD